MYKFDDDLSKFVFSEEAGHPTLTNKKSIDCSDDYQFITLTSTSSDFAYIFEY